MSNSLLVASGPAADSDAPVTQVWPVERAANLPEHPFSTVFPPLSRRAIASRVSKYLKDGQDEPVIVANGQLIVGRNRLEICEAAGLAVEVLDLGDYPEELVEALVATLNMFRRDVSRGDRNTAIESLLVRAGGTMARSQAARVCGMVQR